MTRKSIVLAILLAGCATGPVTKEMRTPKGELLGYLTTAEGSPDLCGWRADSIIHAPDLSYVDHQVVALPGMTCVVVAGSLVMGAAGIHGKSFPKNVGDTLSSDSSSVSGASATSSAVANQREHYEPKQIHRGW